MPDEMLDYNVDTTVQFKLPEMSSEFNSLAVNDLRKVFVEHVKNVFEKDETLGDPGYVSGPLNFKFSGQKVKLQYVFNAVMRTTRRRRALRPTVSVASKKNWRTSGTRSKKSNVRRRKRICPGLIG